MVTDRSEKYLDKNRSDCESRTSRGKEIPKLTGVSNISFPKLNEVLCCQKVAHSVLFYIFVVLFLLVFVYILRKLVSLPVSVSKNGSRKPSNSTATGVQSNSSDALTKRLPQKWPKVGSIVHSLTTTAITPPKDKKSRIYNVANIGEQSYGWSGFAKTNPNPNVEGTTPSHSQDSQDNYREHGIVSSSTSPVSQDKNNENIFNPSLFSNPIGARPSIAENSGLGKTASGIFSSSNAENSDLGSTRNEWTAWDHPVSSGLEKTSSDLSTSADAGFSGLGNKDSRLSAWDFRKHSGPNLAEGRYATVPQNSASGLPNRVTGATAASGGNNEYWGTKSSSWPKWGSSLPDGSGFGWYRENERNPNNPYGTPSPSPNTRFYNDRVSGKWTYPGNNRNAYDYNYNYNPTSKMGIDANAGGSRYSKPTSSNTWNPYYNYGEVNKTEDWSNLNVLNGQNGEMLKTTSSSERKNDVGNFGYPSTTNQNQEINQQHQTFAKISGEEMDNSIHRWPLEEERGKEPADDNSNQLHTAISSHSTKPTSRVNHVKRKKSKQRRFFVHKFTKTKRKHMSVRSKRKRKGKASDHEHHSLKIRESKINKKTQARNNVKKFVIPHRNVLQLHRKRPQVEHWNVKSKVKLRGKKHWLSPKVRRPNKRLHDKKRRKNIGISKNRPKRPRRFLSYSSYKNFVKSHHISDVLVGKWHHTIYHVRHCKRLSQFKTDGLVQLGRQYMHRTRKYKYTILSCRQVDKESNDNDGSQEREDDSDTVSLSGSQICREFWYITSGKIMLTKLKGGDSVNTYTVTLCNTGSSSTDSSVKAPEDKHDTTDLSDNDDADSSDTSNRITNDNGDKDLDSDVSGDDDSNDNSDTNKKTGDMTDDVDIDDKTNAEKRIAKDNNDDDNIDLDDDDDVPEATKGSGTEEQVDDKNSDDDDDDDDFDKNSDNDSQKTHTNNESKDDDTATETDDILTDNTSGGGILATHNSESDDKAIDDDDLDLDKNEDIAEDTSTNTKNKHNHRRKNSVRKNKAKDSKMHSKKSKIIKKKSLITKNPHKRFKLHKTSTTTNDRKHKTASNRDATHDKSNLYERLRQVLVKNDDINNDEDGALAKLVATISQKKSNSKWSEKRNNKKARMHSQKTKNEIRKGTSVKKKEGPLFRKSPITNTQGIRTILQKLLTNSTNVQSHSQVTRKKLKPEQTEVDRKGTEKDTTEKVSAVKPASQADTTDILKALLPRFNLGSTAVTTAAPVPTVQASVPTVQPPVATTHAPNSIPILNLLSKLGIKANINGKTSSVLEGLLPEKKSRDGLSTDKLLETKRTSSIGQGVLPLKDRQLPLYPNASELIPSNPEEQPSVQTENSLRSNIPTAKSPTSSQPLPTPNAPTFTAGKGNAIAAPRLQGTKDGKISDSTSGYSTYRSPKNEGYSLQTPTIKVLCFGDSLTSGYYNHGRGKHPYSIRLGQLLNPGGTQRYTIVTKGVIGEMAHGSMTKRLPKVLNEGTRFDWVLILGGTNDVAHVKNFGDDEEFTSQLISVWSPKIVKDIEQLHATALQYGARTVLMTIPETAYELWPEFQSIRNMRLSVNAALRQYATQVRDTTVLCDLAIKLPRSTLSKELQKFYWNDHIHMNPVGYNKMAEIIEQCIRPYLSK